MFRCEFETSNAAFVDGGPLEVVRVLKRMAGQVAAGDLSGQVRDVNGNAVGYWVFTPEAAE